MVCEHRLERTAIAQVGQNIDGLTHHQRRMVFAALGVKVLVWAKDDRTPRVTLDIQLPLSGILPVVTQADGSTEICIILPTGKVQKYIMRQTAIKELGLEAAASVQSA
jgi:hypothetical protein